MSDRKRILLVSRDLMVLQTRRLMLGAYFDVCSAGRALEARMFLEKQAFDLIVLCYTLTEDECQNIVDAARERCPQARILMLTVTGSAASETAIHPHLPAEGGPFLLVKKSAELLGFEFRSKGRMVPAPEPSVMEASSVA
jgi:hypothetical protein